MARNNAWATADAGILLYERPYCAFRSLVPLATRSPLISFIRAYPWLSVVIRGSPLVPQLTIDRPPEPKFSYFLSGLPIFPSRLTGV